MVLGWQSVPVLQRRRREWQGSRKRPSCWMMSVVCPRWFVGCWTECRRDGRRVNNACLRVCVWLSMCGMIWQQTTWEMQRISLIICPEERPDFSPGPVTKAQWCRPHAAVSWQASRLATQAQAAAFKCGYGMSTAVKSTATLDAKNRCFSKGRDGQGKETLVSETRD
jgi:hypothetical protein